MNLIAKKVSGPERNTGNTNENQYNRREEPLREIKIDPVWIEKIHSYLKSRQQRLNVVKRTVTREGQTLDWIPIKSQTSNGEIASPPPKVDEIDHSDPKRPDLLFQFELETQKEARGPKGTVPVLYRPVETLRPVVPLKHFLLKHGRPTYKLCISEVDELEVPSTNSEHWYAYSSHYVTNYGGAGYINAWNPYVEWSNEFSLGQIVLARGSGSNKQTLEAGWQVYKQLYGDWRAHLFIFFTTNGYTSSGDNKGGYNMDVDGWVQYSSTIYPGAISSPVSTLGGSQYIMKVKFQLWKGNWWLRVNDRWIGYYPARLFSSSGLRSQASKIAFYGEVIDSTHSGMTETDMGSGHWPYEGWRKCAYMRALRYQSSTGGSMSRYDPGTVWKNDRECYDIEGHFDNTGSWGSYFWWGGSGKNSKCT